MEANFQKLILDLIDWMIYKNKIKKYLNLISI